MLKAILFDIDGVLWVRGTGKLPYTDKIFEVCKQNQIDVYITTNSVLLTPQEWSKRLGVDEKNVITPAVILKDVSDERGYSSILSIAESSVRKMLPNIEFKEKNVDAVFAGFSKDINYEILASAFHEIMRGADFLAQSMDRYHAVKGGVEPGSALVVGALKATTGKDPEVLGKPSMHFIKFVERRGIKPNEILVVGDNWETDIAMALKLNSKSIFIEWTHKIEDKEKFNIRADYEVKNQKELFELLKVLIQNSKD